MNEFIVQIKEKWDKIKEQDKLSKGKNMIVGRYISEPFADGKAVYQIVKENKDTVNIKSCKGLGDSLLGF